MTRPKDISDEVWDAADLELDINAVSSDVDVLSQLRISIARAIMAAQAEEREACAVLAKDRVWSESDYDRASNYESGGSDVAEEIAAAIRKRGEQTP